MIIKENALAGNAVLLALATGRKKAKKSPSMTLGLNPPLEEGGGDIRRCCTRG
jgi:hypothetical protein